MIYEPYMTGKIGDWVVFVPEWAKAVGYYTAVWNIPMTLCISAMSMTSYNFSQDQMVPEGDVTNTNYGNDKRTFRKATPEEVLLAVDRELESAFKNLK